MVQIVRHRLVPSGAEFCREVVCDFGLRHDLPLHLRAVPNASAIDSAGHLVLHCAPRHCVRAASPRPLADTRLSNFRYDSLAIRLVADGAKLSALHI